MTITLVDFHQTIISACAIYNKELRDADGHSFIRHLTLVQLQNLKSKFGGKMILCADSDEYWRRNIYPYYKGHRKFEKLNKDFLDWDMVYENVKSIKEELKRNFPYILLEIEGAEADDCIASLVKYFQENETVKNGLFEEPVDITICSSDGDFQQLQKYDNVKQWSNKDSKFIVCKNPEKYLMEHIAKGDKADNIPSVTTGDWWAKARSENEKTRAISLKSSRLPDFEEHGIDACSDIDERLNFKRNKQLIDFDMIPVDLYNSVIESYKTYKYVGSKSTAYNYMIKNKMKLLLNSVSDFRS